MVVVEFEERGPCAALLNGELRERLHSLFFPTYAASTVHRSPREWLSTLLCKKSKHSLFGHNLFVPLSLSVSPSLAVSRCTAIYGLTRRTGAVISDQYTLRMAQHFLSTRMSHAKAVVLRTRRTSHAKCVHTYRVHPYSVISLCSVRNLNIFCLDIPSSCLSLSLSLPLSPFRGAQRYMF